MISMFQGGRERKRKGNTTENRKVGNGKEPSRLPSQGFAYQSR
jgi:hypothetical protein